MVNLEELLIDLVNALPYSEFKKACEAVAIDPQLILDMIALRGE